jgi:hypothetical protein
MAAALVYPPQNYNVGNESLNATDIDTGIVDLKKVTKKYYKDDDETNDDVKYTQSTMFFF